MTPPKQSPEPSAQEIEKTFREELRRDAIDAAHFFGLAALYEERGKQQQAVECLEIARRKDVVNPFAHKLQGKIHFRRKNFNEAAEELRKARRYNPFDRETAEILGRAEYECEHHREALEATIDAFLLVAEGDRENAERLKKRIRTFKAIRKISSQEMVELFRERRDKLQTAFDRLEWQRSRLLRRVDPSTPEMTATATATTAPAPPDGHLKLAGRLRRLDMWSGLDDDQVYLLSGAAREEFHPKGTRIFSYGSENADIYTLEQGKIAIRRPTPYGTYNLGTLPPGTVFGEVNFISHSERSGDAVA
ncbi:MAG: cyclic nucleotide-binding domain-containing protein, partial [bacterium]|nr:cyclic nucleotide-binding domain-containing protein [bacterium]